MISPIINARLYTDGGEDTPRFIDIEAEFETHETGLYESLSHAIIYNVSNNSFLSKWYAHKLLCFLFAYSPLFILLLYILYLYIWYIVMYFRFINFIL